MMRIMPFFVRLRGAQSANQIDPPRNALFDAKLTPIAKMAGASNPREFVRLLRTNRLTHLHRAVAEAMTVNETSFYRDVKTFDLLRTKILPELIERKRTERRLRIWSAASSTGQEAYSVGMLLLEHLPETAYWDIQILGTDISQRVVEYAKRAVTAGSRSIEDFRFACCLKYMTRDEEEWEVHPRLRAMREFQQLNLCALTAAASVFDLSSVCEMCFCTFAAATAVTSSAQSIVLMARIVAFPGKCGAG